MSLLITMGVHGRIGTCGEISLVVFGRIRMDYLCLTYIRYPSLLLVWFFGECE